MACAATVQLSLHFDVLGKMRCPSKIARGKRPFLHPKAASSSSSTYVLKSMQE